MGVQPNLATQVVGHHPADTQTQPGALLVVIQLVETVEDAIGLVGRNAGPVIGHIEGNIARILNERAADDNLSGIGILARVGEEIDEDLLCRVEQFALQSVGTVVERSGILEAFRENTDAYVAELLKNELTEVISKRRSCENGEK